MDEPVKKKWYQKTLGIALLIFLFFPVGLYLMWKYATWDKIVKWLITGFYGIVVLGSVLSGSNATTITTPQPTSQPVQATEQNTQPPTNTPKPTKIPVKITNTPAPIQTKQTAPISSGSVSQSNAVKKAKSYLAYTAFSHDGLVDQLEYEQFSPADAVYGADNSGANWNEQAAKKAKSYMDYSAYSRDGLIDQLKYEKFTQEQAEYGANAVGL